MTRVIKFDYLPIPQSDPITKKIGAVYRPMIPIRLGMNHKISKYPAAVLLDSGADRNLFPAQMAESLGIKIVNKKPAFHEGIGKTVLKAYEHKAIIYVNSVRIETTIDFSIDHEISLLGRTGFFKFFESVKFFEKGIDGFVELEYR